MDAIVTFDEDTERLWIEPSPESTDLTEGGARAVRVTGASGKSHTEEARFSGAIFFFKVPVGWSMETTHPDLIALAVITCLHPYVGTRLSLNVAVSDEFREACSSSLPYACTFPAGPERILPRRTGTFPGLAFSGGTDSTAALTIMPTNTIVFFLDRPSDMGLPTLYVKEPAVAACRALAATGYQVHLTETNVEILRIPLGFPMEWSSGAPAVLLADYCDLSSVSWGIVAETAYRMGHERFRNCVDDEFYAPWDTLLRAVGLSLGLPVAGLSEVGTSVIAQRSPMSKFTQSCIRGTLGRPCLACAKCFRKLPLDAALVGRKFPTELFDRLFRFPGGPRILLNIPIHHEDVYRWIAEHLELSDSSISWDAFKRRLAACPRDVSWSRAWYPPSAHLIPPEYRDHAIEQIRSHLPDHSATQQHSFESWDLRETSASAELATSVELLREALAAVPSVRPAPVRAETHPAT